MGSGVCLPPAMSLLPMPRKSLPSFQLGVNLKQLCRRKAITETSTLFCCWLLHIMNIYHSYYRLFHHTILMTTPYFIVYKFYNLTNCWVLRWFSPSSKTILRKITRLSFSEHNVWAKPHPFRSMGIYFHVNIWGYPIPLQHQFCAYSHRCSYTHPCIHAN